MSLLARIERAAQEAPLHFTLLDPASVKPEQAVEKSRAAAKAGSFALMVGGSAEVTPQGLDATVASMKEAGLPIILFPNGAATGISRHADAIFFMSLLNSDDPRFLAREQARGAPVVKKLGIEPIPMGYIVVEPGMRAGQVGRAALVARSRPETAVGYALAAQYFGMRLVYLEAGSGAPEPVPAAMVAAVREAIDIPLIVGGGIRTPEAARSLVKAGADILVTGTLVEEVRDVEARVGAIVQAIRHAR